MSSRRLLTVAISGALIAAALVGGCSQALRPKIEVDSKMFDFGDVKEGIELKHTFHLRNAGNGVLNIFEAYSSCGCTTPKLTKNKLSPGETTDLDVSIDTAMKQDAVTKTVFVSSNDPAQPLLPVDLRMRVENLHKAMNLESGSKIFTDSRCAACHVDQGVGLVGKDLFEADCAMCHGAEAKGAVGPALRGPYRNKVYAAHVRQVIAEGSKTHHSMPGFAGESGGPLSNKQIDSLVKYLTEISAR